MSILRRLCLCTPIAALLLAGCGDAPAVDELTDELADPLPIPEATAETLDDGPLGVPEGSQLAPGFAPLAFDLAGTGWLVTAVDGVPVADLQDDLANIYFGASQIRWRGCNAKEALYIPLSASFALGSATVTDAACGDNKIDAAMDAVIPARPLIGRNREGKVMLAAAGHALTLSQVDSGPKDAPAPPLDKAPFVIFSSGAPGARAVLTLHKDSFSVWMDCDDAITGSLRLVDGRLRTGRVQAADCETYRATARKELADFFRSSPYISRGAAGELLLSDGTNVYAARQCHPDAAPCRRAAPAIHMAEPQDGADAAAQAGKPDAAPAA